MITATSKNSPPIVPPTIAPTLVLFPGPASAPLLESELLLVVGPSNPLVCVPDVVGFIAALVELDSGLEAIVLVD